MKKELALLAMVLSLSLAISCGGTSSSDGGGDGGGGGGDGGVSDVSMTIPTDIVVSSPTAQRTTASAISAGSPAKAAATDDYETKRAVVETLVAGTGECTFSSIAIGSLSNATCYGPAVSYTSHPTRSPSSGQFGGGDLGIWNEYNVNNASEACAAAQMNNVVDFAAGRVDNFVNIIATIGCAAKKGSLSLPSVGSSADLSSVISTYVSVTGLAISSATLERLTDSGTNPVYRFNIAGTLTISGTSYPITITLKHIPTATDNSTYEGKISFKLVTSSTGQPGNCGDAAQGFAAVTQPGSVDAGTILYEKTSSTAVVYELNMGSFCGASTNPFDSDNNISVTDTLSISNPDGYGNGYQYGLFSINPENGTGQVAYAWVAGRGEESARTLNVTTTQATDGSASGYAYFGYGPAMSSSTETDRGTITGMQCNWGSGVVVQKVQRQKLTRPATGTTVFGSDSASLNITFAPTDNCDSVGLPFTYESTGGGMDNDNALGNAVTDNLLDIVSMSFTRPTPPGDV